jgi:peroxin-6
MASSELVGASHKNARRKKRRRRRDKPAITARLVLDDNVKSDVGILSDDLFADLFPQLRDSQYLSIDSYI